MSLGWIAALLGLAFLDAMNPFSIAAMVFLLSTDRPVLWGLVFLVGTFAVYLFGGVVLLEGWLVVLRTFLPSLPGWAPGGLEMLAGGLASALVLAGIALLIDGARRVFAVLV
ncbi:MAG: GAP family protein [Phenylobacterium sp.]|uniref:GAP family protein n=1 Tax=Phenylobacterium sp. TaxID=1871053 RepID=UPI0025D8E0EF|nr:GAP family protein [Phenylobacterium sp.]MCG9917427.1 GAP family protein [Phenylobacterium sp.]